MKKLFLTGLLFLIGGSLFAQQVEEFTGSLLWRVSGKGLEKPSYIFGTHHLADLSVLDGISELQNALDSIEQVVGEIDLENKAQLNAKMEKAILLPQEYSYETMLTEEEYAVLDSALTHDFGRGLQEFGVFKPGAITMFYAVFEFQKNFPERDLTNHIAIDDYFQQIANENGKPFVELETIEEQVYIIMESVPYKDMAKSLACSVKYSEYNSNTTKYLLDLYLKYDLSGLYKILDSHDIPCPLDQEFKNKVNKERNDKWILKLPQIMKDKSSFIAVGALHIAGEDGLLFQLSKLGYTVEAVK